jgi:serine/threonine protein kinase
MASVWVARLKGKHGFEKLVAIKTILPKYASDERFQQMFLDEARIAAGIEHTNVAQILDLGEEHDVLYLVMEWVDGDSLSKLMRLVEKKKDSIPSGVVCRILADVCGGLHVAHELRGADGKPLGVVHRDVSPQNILVSTKGVAKLIDFGIAKAKDRLSGETSAGLLKGKVQYMAPEQALGQPIDARADIWAVGAILYHVFTGKPAYDGDNQLAQLHQLTSGKPPLPLPASVPAAVGDVIKKCLSFKPESRFATAADLQRAIERAMLDAGISTSPSDVAAFARNHVQDRAEARRKSVDLALKAASERAKMAEMLRAPGDDTPTPLHDGGSQPGITSSTGVGSNPGAASSPGSASSPGAGSSTGVMSNPSLKSASEPPDTTPFEPQPEVVSVPSQTSSTLGAGVITPPAAPAIGPPVSQRRRALTYLLAGTVGAALIVLAAALSVGKKPDATQPPRVPIAAAGQPPAMNDTPPVLPEPIVDPIASVPTIIMPPKTTVATARVVTPPPPPHPGVGTAATKQPPPKASAKPPGKPTVDDGF